MHTERLSILCLITCLAIVAIVGMIVVLGNQPVHASPDAHYAASGDVYCVTQGGGGPYPGCDQVFTSVQAAVDAASGGETIKVAQGTYTGVQGRLVPPGYIGQYLDSTVITQVVYIAKSVTIRGGYTTSNWSASDPIAHPTTLDAQGQGRVLFIAGDVNPTIEGLRITGGDAAWLGGVDLYGLQGGGGGIYIVSATATLKNNWVFSNTARFGGGLYLSCSDATIRGNTIVANTAEWYPSVWPGFGGGLYLYQSNATLAGNVIMSNTTDYSGGGLYLEGSSAWLNRNTISSNTADEEGGGLSLFNSGAKLTGNVISFNSADGDYAYGGGALVVDSDPTLEANTVISNSASAGGGLALIDSNGTLVNNIVADNLVDAVGSGLVIEFDLESGPLRLLHTTIARNRGGDGSGVYVSCYYSSHCVVAMTNTVLVSQTLGVYATSGSTVTLQATLWGTATWANESDWGGAGNIITGTPNLWGDPVFADPDAGDYRVITDSAAIDAGVDAGVRTDIDNQPRPYQTPDLGADEYWPPGALKHVYLPLIMSAHTH